MNPDSGVRRSHELGYEDSFGKLIADSTTNIANLSSNYPYSPERWRVSYDAGSTGTYQRRLIQYGDDANFTDSVDTHDLSVGAGDTMKIQTAQEYSYIVQYVIRPSFAFQINQALEPGDKATIAFGDADLNNDMANADGWIIEFEGGEQTDTAFWSMYRDGEITSNGGERKLLQLNRPYTTWKRMAMDINWYNVGHARLIETYTKDGTQFNPRIKDISSDDRKGPEEAIHPIQFSVQASSSTTGLTFSVGSAALISLGDTDEIFRAKSFSRIEPLTITGEWEPIFAMRVDPNRSQVATFLESMTLLNFTESEKVRIQAQSFAPEKVTFDGTDSWKSPPELSAQNSAFETRTDPDQIPDNTGTLVSSTNDLGGWQIGVSVLSVSQLQGSTFSVQPAQQKTIRPIYSQDVIVICGKSDLTGDITFDANIQQKW